MAQNSTKLPDKDQADSKADRSLLKLPLEYAAPQSELEHQICGIFSDVMRVSTIGVNDDFYDLGGDSLMGEQISMEILGVTGHVFPISMLFEAGTPKAIAAFLGDGSKNRADDQGTTIFVVHGRGGFSSPRREFMSAISSKVRLSMFEFPGIRGDQPHPLSIRETAKTYVRQIMETQPEGPIHLASFCAGGLIALDMADELAMLDRPLDRLVLIDPSIPKRVVRNDEARARLAINPDSLAAKTNFALRTGRLPGGHPFLSPLLNWIDLRIRAFAALPLVRSQNRRNGERYANQGLKDGPRAWLIASYRHADPKPFRGLAIILASNERADGFLDRRSIWEKLLPNRQVIVLAAGHHDVLNGASGEVASAMERGSLSQGLDPRVDRAVRGS